MKRYDIVGNQAEGSLEKIDKSFCRIIRKVNHKGDMIIDMIAHNDLGFFNICRDSGMYWIQNTACAADDMQVANVKANHDFFNINKKFLTRKSAVDFLLEFIAGKLEFSSEKKV